MSAQDVLLDIGLILAAGLIAIPVAAVLRVPVMVVMLGAGILIGPSVADWVDNPVQDLGAQLVFTLGVSLILFHGGLGVSLRVISKTAVGLGLIVLPGLVLTAVIVALVAAPVFSVPFSVALLIGATLAPTDPAILIPLFDRLGIRQKLEQTLVAESAFNDPTGTVLALTVAGVVEAGSFGGFHPLGEFTKSLALGIALGVVGGIVLAFMVSSRRVGVWRESPAVAILAVIALTYFTTDELGGSAYLAAFLMGLIVGNSEHLRLGDAHEHTRRLGEFMEDISELCVLAVFVTLGINLPLQAVWDNLWGGLVVMAAFLLIARPVTVLACMLPDRRGAWTREELVFLSWSRETGVVPAAIAGVLLARGVEGAELVSAMVALAVVVTLLLQATSAGALARRLGLVDDSVAGEEVSLAQT